ncbi:MAG: FecR family protein, partial [Bacteroidetes bacterium]|nr:FecR family protein [Bacteroidota bacterium]
MAKLHQYRVSWLLSSTPTENPNTDISRMWDRIEKEILSKDTEKPSRKIRENKYQWLRYAAGLLLMLGLGSALTWMLMKPVERLALTTEYNVPKGSKSSLKLPDGTIVWLNAGSKLTYTDDFNQNERNVYLTGEAYFNVVTNKEKPFRVHTSELLIRALGTRFNVKAYPEERIITTTLEEGIIDVQVLKKNENGVNRQIKIKPHEKLVFFKDGYADSLSLPRPKEELKKISFAVKNIRVESEVNTELYTSWKSDKWIIEGLTLKCLAPMLERRYNINIHFNND